MTPGPVRCDGVADQANAVDEHPLHRLVFLSAPVYGSVPNNRYATSCWTAVEIDDIVPLSERSGRSVPVRRDVGTAMLVAHLEKGTHMLTVDPPIDHTASTAIGHAGRAFWLFIGSFLSFVGVIVVSMLLSNSEYQTALYDRAEELGVNQNFLPADELADIVRTYPESTVVLVTTAVLFLFSATLLAWGFRRLGVIAGHSNLTYLAMTLAVLGGVCMAVMTFLPKLLADGNGWLLDNWWIYMTLVGIAVIASCVALIVTVVAMRPSGLARRTGIVVAALCALTIVAQLTVTAPPIVPTLLAAVFAFNVRRAARTAT